VIAIYADDVAHKHSRPKETAARLDQVLDLLGDKSLADINRKTCEDYVSRRGVEARPVGSLKTCARPSGTIGRRAYAPR
jgi:hypothetical protein